MTRASEDQTTTVKPEITFIEDLLEEILAGQLRVPRFQRPFVWKPEDMRQLFDSIYNGYPIGSLLIWETAERLESLDAIGPIELPHPSSKPVSYILDGHQRLATLLAGLRQPKDAPLSRAPSDWKWWIFFDLARKQFTHVTNSVHDVKLFPVRALLRTADFLECSRQIQKEVPEHADGYIIEAESLAQKMRGYKVPAIRIRGGTLGAAVSIFSRLNSLGERMTADQMVSALTYREGETAVNLAGEIDGILEELQVYNFDQFPRKQLLQVVLAAAGLDQNTGDWEVIARQLRDQAAEASSMASSAVLSAARFLYEAIGVPGSNYLPYVNQFVVLTAFFLQRDWPTAKQAEILKRWFWGTSLGGWFAGASPSVLRRAIDEMKSFGADPERKFEVMPLEAEARPLPTEYNSKVARIRCLLIFLFSRSPRSPETLEPLEAQEVQGENRGLTYVFNRAERILLSHPANRIMIHKKPGKTVREQILDVTEERRQQFLESHCISEEALRALEQDDAATFIMCRGRHIEQAEAKSYERFGVRPPAELETEQVDIDTE